MESSEPRKLTNTEIIDRILFIGNTLIINPYKEIFNGLNTGILPLFECLFLSTIINTMSLLDIDIYLLNKFGLLSLYPTTFWSQKFYFLLCTFSGFYLWGLYQSLLQLKLRKRLTKTFADAGLKTFTGRLPQFIFDKAIDDETRCMKLKCNGSDISQFKTAQSKIESDLLIYIDEITENRTHGTVDIVYSVTPLSKNFKFPSMDCFIPDSFIVGKGRTKHIGCLIDDFPHLLVAGQTGGGKSTFLRQLITTLYLKNPSYQFILIDPKLTEFHVFQGLPRVDLHTSAVDGVHALRQCCNELIQQRKEVISHNGCTDFNEFLKIPTEKRKFPANIDPKDHLSKKIIVIDEAINLFMAGLITPELSKKAKESANIIASQGRALGVHIVIATQRPDRFAIDPQIKANLVGKLCYRMPNNASSMTILDSKKAATLSGIKGRAIWQEAAGMFVVQTPNLSLEQAKELLKDHYLVNNPVEIEKSKKEEQLINEANQKFNQTGEQNEKN